MSAYRPLFSLEVAHSYFPAGVCRGLGFTPSAVSAQRLERIGCLLRPTDRGLVVLFDAAAADALVLHASDADEPLRIDLLARSVDAHFANYTEGVFGSPHAVLMLDSQHAVHDETTGRWRLHAAAGAGSADVRPINSAEAFEALSAQERRAPPHAVFTIRINPADVTQALEQPRRYLCQLQARATVWKYCLFGELAQDQADVQVVDLGQAFEFGAAVGERLASGHSVLAVRSSQPIELQERSPQRFQLRRLGTGADKVLIKRLPVASPSQLNRETLGGVPTWVSEIYVHR